MGRIKVRYHTIRCRGTRKVGYWQPTKAMREAGFGLVSCGEDGPSAWRIAEEWNQRWDAFRKGGLIRRWPIGSLGAAFDEYRLTGAWTDKKPRTREDWERGWRYIEPCFADILPATVTLAQIDDWYRSILRDKGVREAWRALKIWRALWQVAAALKYCDKTADPSSAIRRKTPKARQETWTEGEVVRKVKAAIRGGYLGLACIIAIAWDGSLSPVDARKLTFAQMERQADCILFRLGRAKTGRAAIGTLGRRASKLVEFYLSTLPAEQMPAAVIFRNRSGRPYSKDTLGDDFRTIRGKRERRTLADMRRSGAIEALAGGAKPAEIGAKLANGIGPNEELNRTYLPVDETIVRAVDDARKIGRRNIRKTKSLTPLDSVTKKTQGTGG